MLDPVSLTELELAEPVDAAFSNAVFHWIKDHDALFERLHAALRPGAPLVAQCGGKGNIDVFRRLADEVAAEPPYAEHMASFAGPWNYAAPEETEERLLRAGFEDVRCWLEPWPVNPDGAARVRHAPSASATTSRSSRRSCASPFAAEVVRRCGEPLDARVHPPQHHARGADASLCPVSGTPAFAEGKRRSSSGRRRMRKLKLVVSAVVAALVVAALAAGSRGRVGAGRHGHHPSGSPDLTEGGQCTANFIYTDAGGTYIGQAAHCASTGAATDTDGCLAGTLPLGTPSRSPGPAGPARSSTARG